MRNLIFLSLAVSELTFAASVPARKVPFWKSKAKVYQRIVEDRDIIVSAKTEDQAVPPAKLPHVLMISGGAQVAAPLNVTYKTARNFDELAKTTDHLKELKFDPAASELYVHLEGLGHHSKMWMQLRFEEQDSFHNIHFEVVRGNFEGLNGDFRFEDVERLKTEISMTAQYPFDKLGFPQTLIELGLEGMLKLMAFRMREYVESKYKSI